MRIIFMGTPAFAEATLQALISTNHDILAVYTQPDKPSGRGHKMLASPVKTLALHHNLAVFQPPSLRSTDVVEQIIHMKPDVIVVVAYGQLLPQNILDIPRYGCLNIHGSLLPQYRGAAPIHWAILNGDTQTGVTIIKMDAGMDTGDILAMERTDILPDDNTLSLYERLKTQGASLLLNVLEKLPQNLIIPVPQNNELATYSALITRDMEKIDWHNSATAIHNQIRALNSAFTLDANNDQLKIWRTQVINNIQGAPGEIIRIDKTGFTVATGQDGLHVLEVQPANRKRMSARDFANGKQLVSGITFH